MEDFATDGRSWEVDARGWPLLVVRRLAGSIADAALDEALDHVDEMLDARDGKYSIVIDNQRGSTMTPTQRKRLTERMRARRSRAETRCVGTAFVITSPLVRGVLTAILWVTKPYVETRVFAQFPDAAEWALHRHRTILAPSG